MAKPVGVILAGGQGKRIGGAKAAALLQGRSLLQHSIERLQPQCSAIAVNAGPDFEHHMTGGIALITEMDFAGAGPLAGILTALRWAEAQGRNRVVTVPVDAPFLPVDLCAKLTNQSAPIVMARTSDGWQGTCASWSVAVLPALFTALRQGVRKVTDFATAHGVLPCDFGQSKPPAFFNINTRDDLAQAEEWLRA